MTEKKDVIYCVIIPCFHKIGITVMKMCRKK